MEFCKNNIIIETKGTIYTRGIGIESIILWVERG